MRMIPVLVLFVSSFFLYSARLVERSRMIVAIPPDSLR